MTQRVCRRFAGLLVVLSFLVVDDRVGFDRARAQSIAAQARPAGSGPSARPEDERAIRAIDDAFVRDYNRGDSRALAAHFTDDAEAIEADGGRLEGRGPIERRFAETFADGPGVRIAIEAESIRFLGPDAAREEGRTVVNAPGGGRQVRPYTALLVRQDGRWRIASIREESDPMVRPHDRLRDLEWMVGDWVDESPDAEVRVNGRWSEDGNFLLRSFTVRRRGKAVMTVSQRIGWDPMARRIRSWEFDSEGGFGEGTWSRDGDRWIVKRTGVRAEGVAASSTNIMVLDRTDLVRWSSTDRVLGSEAIPGSVSYVMVRVPPPPRTPTTRPAAPSPPGTTRSR